MTSHSTQKNKDKIGFWHTMSTGNVFLKDWNYTGGSKQYCYENTKMSIPHLHEHKMEVKHRTN